MTEIRFPVDPAIGRQHSFGNKIYTWNGFAWDYMVVSPQYITQVFSHGPINPTDETEYFFGAVPDDLPFTSYCAPASVVSLFTGNIESASITSHIGTFSDSSETSTFLLRNETTGEEIEISSTTTHNSETSSMFTFPNVLFVTAGDLLTAKWITPTWSTSNPLQVRNRIEIKIKLS